MGTSFEIASEQFVGPIELLLQLVRKRKLHINEVGLAKVADSFLEHFNNMPDMSMHHATHFLSVAATLVYVKSKSLFPEIDVDEEAEGALSQLVDRVRLFSLVQNQLPVIQQQLVPHITRKPKVAQRSGFQPNPSVTPYTLGVTMRQLLVSLQEVALIKKRKTTKRIRPRIALSMMMQGVQERMKNIGSSAVSFTDMVLNLWRDIADKGTGYERRDASISGFLAALELVKQKDLACSQETVFAEITLTTFLDTDRADNNVN